MLKSTFFFAFVMICSAQLAQGQQWERYKHLTDTTLISKELGFEKKITVTVPVEWQKNIDRQYPLVVVFDRQNQRSHGYILRTIDYLTSNEQMPSCVIISIASEQKYRYLETLHKATDPDGLLPQTEAFLFRELVPLAEQLFKASGFRLFIGHSRYGYFTTALFASRPAEVQAVISLSPFFEQTNVQLTDSMAALIQTPATANRYYRFGIGNDYPADYAKMDSVLRRHNNPQLNLKGILFPEADHNVTPGLTIGPALYDVFEHWSAIQARYMAIDTTKPAPFRILQQEIASHYGVPFAFSLGILNGKGWELYNKKRYREAIAAWELLLEYYPNFSEAWLYIMDARLKTKQDVKAAKQQFLTSLKDSQLYSAEEKKELMAEYEQLK